MKELIFIVFFIATYIHACTQETELVTTTTVPDGPSTVQIEMLADSTLRINGDAIAVDNLIDHLDLLAQQKPIENIVLIVDRAATTGELVSVMDILKTAGHHSLRLEESSNTADQ